MHAFIAKYVESPTKNYFCPGLLSAVAFIVVVASESEVMLVNFVHKIFLQPLSSRAKVTLIKNAPTWAKGVTTYLLSLSRYS